MDNFFVQPYWGYFIITLVTSGLVLLIRLGLKRYQPPDPDPFGVIARRKKEESQKIIKQMLEERDDSSKSEFTDASFSDLTVGDLKILLKDFSFYCFVVFLIFGIPYLILRLGFGLVETVIPKETHSSFYWLMGIGLAAIVMITLFKDPAYTLAWFSVFFRNMSMSMSRLSRTSQILLFSALIGYFYLAIAYPNVWIVLSLCLMPFEFAYGRYQTILKGKSQGKLSQ